MMSPEDAKRHVFNYWQYLIHLAHKRFANNPQLAEEAMDYLLDKLQQNDWQRIRDYRGQGFTAFLTVVANRLLIDFARKVGEIAFVPEWVEARGHLWVRAYGLLQKKLSKQETLEILWVEGQQLGYEKQAIDEIVHTLTKQHVWKLRATTINVESEELEQAEDDSLTPMEQTVQQQQQALFAIVAQLLACLYQPTTAVATHEFAEAETLQRWLQVLRGKISLESEEFLLLQLVYRDGLTVSEAGRRLQLNANQVAGKHRRLLQRLRETFEQCGIAEELRALL